MGNICISNGVNKLAELDTTILRYNLEYPSVGFPISQATEFDHRLSEVVAESKTSSDGSFKIEKIPEGEYNFVAQKQGFGWKYVFNVPINSGSNNSMTQLLKDQMTTFLNYTTNLNQLFSRQARQSHTFLSFNLLPLTFTLNPLSFNLYPLSLNNQITLYPETEINGTLNKDIIWERDRHYIVNGDITVPQNTSLTMSPGVLVRFDGRYKLKVEGTLQAVGEQENMIVFTSNRETPKKGDWNKLVFEGVDSTSVIKLCKIEWGNIGISCERASPRIENNVIRAGDDTGVLANNNSSTIFVA